MLMQINADNTKFKQDQTSPHTNAQHSSPWWRIGEAGNTKACVSYFIHSIDYDETHTNCDYDIIFSNKKLRKLFGKR